MEDAGVHGEYFKGWIESYKYICRETRERQTERDMFDELQDERLINANVGNTVLVGFPFCG